MQRPHAGRMERLERARGISRRWARALLEGPRQARRGRSRRLLKVAFSAISAREIVPEFLTQLERTSMMRLLRAGYELEAGHLRDCPRTLAFGSGPSKNDTVSTPAGNCQ